MIMQGPHSCTAHRDHVTEDPKQIYVRENQKKSKFEKQKLPILTINVKAMRREGKYQRIPNVFSSVNLNFQQRSSFYRPWSMFSTCLTTPTISTCSHALKRTCVKHSVKFYSHCTHIYVRLHVFRSISFEDVCFIIFAIISILL